MLDILHNIILQVLITMALNMDHTTTENIRNFITSDALADDHPEAQITTRLHHQHHRHFTLYTVSMVT